VNIYHTRNIYNSIFYHLKNLLISGGLIVGAEGDLTFTDSYPNEEQMKKMVPLCDYDSSDENLIVLPVISFENPGFIEKGLELGTLTKERKSTFIISVFAESDIQADYLVDFVVSGLQSHNIRLYDYNQDYIQPPDMGKIIIDDGLSAAFHYFTGANSIFRNTVDIIFTTITNKI